MKSSSNTIADSFVFLNGEFLPAASASVSIFDRGFLYGDALFETMRIYSGRPFRWKQHWERLVTGAGVMGISLPCKSDSLLDSVFELIRRNRAPEAVLRISLSRGPGPSNYSTVGSGPPTVAMHLRAAPVVSPQEPVKWRLATASYRLSVGDPLLRLKTANKLVQVLARREAEAAAADEALLLNTRGEVAEAAAGNVFWFERGTLCTPPTDAGLLPGVTRDFVLELARLAGIPTREIAGPPRCLLDAEAVFLSLSTLEIVPVIGLDGHPLPQSPRTRELHEAYRRQACQEPPG